MAQTTVKFPGASKQSSAGLAHKQLEIEKAGVIAGFLAGLPVALGPVSEMLASAGASDFASGLGMVLTVAVTTRVGLLLGAKAAAALAARR